MIVNWLNIIKYYIFYFMGKTICIIIIKSSVYYVVFHIFLLLQ